MLDTNNFVEQLIEQGYSHVCVVPCSFSKYFINAIINNKKIEYVSCANEAVAVSIAAGLSMSGQKVIVLMQSSGLTNAGSCITSLLNPYNILFPIIVSWRTYHEDDSEIQHAHLADHLPKLIKAYGYEYEILKTNNEDSAVQQILSCETKKVICVLNTGTFSEVLLDDEHKQDLSEFAPRSHYLKELNLFYHDRDTVFIGTTGNTCREMHAYMPGTCNFYMAGNMGGALSIALGAYLAGKSVIVCGGDAEFVMHLGGLTTASRYQVTTKNNRLIYMLFDNLSNKSTGGQSSYQQHLNYSGIVAGTGLPCSETIVNICDFKTRLSVYNENEGMFFLHVKCGFDDTCPRPPISALKNKAMFDSNKDKN